MAETSANFQVRRPTAGERILHALGIKPDEPIFAAGGGPSDPRHPTLAERLAALA